METIHNPEELTAEEADGVCGGTTLGEVGLIAVGAAAFFTGEAIGYKAVKESGNAAQAVADVINKHQGQ